MRLFLFTGHSRGVSALPSLRQTDADDTRGAASRAAHQSSGETAGRARPLQRAPGVVHQRTGDIMALVDFRRSRYYTLNDVGGLIWERLAAQDPGSAGRAMDTQPQTVESIAAQIATEYDVPVERARSDVVALLRELAAARLVTWA